MERLYKNRVIDLEEGKQIDISESCKEAGLLITMFVTLKVWEEIIAPDEEALKRGETEKSRIKEILSELVTVIRVSRQSRSTNILKFKAELTVEGKSDKFDLISYLAPVSLDINKPSITILTADEV